MKQILVVFVLCLAAVLSFAVDPKPTTPPNAAPGTNAAPDAVKSCWITTSFGVRHNANCRYYKNSKGRAALPTEGRACKICGG